METTITFVLGALCGLFLLGIVYAFIGVLKMQKQIKNQQQDFNHLQQQVDYLNEQTHLIISENAKEVHGRLDEILRDLEQQRQDEVRRSNEDYQGLRKLLDDTNRYVDKRVDHCNGISREYIDKKIENTVDVLCTRMDLSKEQIIKS